MQQNMSLDTLISNVQGIDEDRLIKVIRWLTDNGKITEFGGQLVWV